MSSSSSSKKSKGEDKQPNLREFLFKRMKSQGSFNETIDSPPSPLSSPPTQDVNMEIGSSSACDEPLDDDCDEPLDDDWVCDVELLPHDPGLRKNIMDYPPNERNPVRRAYILKKPCQLKTHVFPQKQVGGLRRFSVNWFKKWDWLEYSVEKDAAFCFACYLFKRDVEIYNGGDAFVNGGFKWWNKPDRFQKHVILDEMIIDRFKSMKTRRMNL
ncbi:uncharacterized protein LOC130818832 [Amaranthus tricolor]|uniref:uncharacterized protein LOC130818832 n=1 Tax=Amaranthus tricolor TaxID=29722 RepID=UPI002583A4B7|nr:uncharacterized protein LOC130818832 [Amaranthus tricolor]